MKRIPRMDDGSRFRAHIRHYHRTSTPRSGSRRETSWQEWVDGGEPASRGKVWLFISLAAVAMIGLTVLAFSLYAHAGK